MKTDTSIALRLNAIAQGLASVVIAFVLMGAAAFGAHEGSARDKQLAARAAVLKSTDDRVVDYSEAIAAHPEVSEYQTLLAGAFLQKVREQGTAAISIAPRSWLNTFCPVKEIITKPYVCALKWRCTVTTSNLPRPTPET